MELACFYIQLPIMARSIGHVCTVPSSHSRVNTRLVQNSIQYPSTVHNKVIQHVHRKSIRHHVRVRYVNSLIRYILLTCLHPGPMSVDERLKKGRGQYSRAKQGQMLNYALHRTDCHRGHSAPRVFPKSHPTTLRHSHRRSGTS